MHKRIFFLLCLHLYFLISVAAQGNDKIVLHQTRKLWKSQPPRGCPFKKSNEITGMAFAENFVSYGNADTFLMSWAGDDNLYSPYMDGTILDSNNQSVTHLQSGLVVISGNDPLNLNISPIKVSINQEEKIFVYDKRSVLGDLSYQGLGPILVNGNTYDGVYSCANLFYKGVWYLGPEIRDVSMAHGQDGNYYNWAFTGPFLGFRISTNKGYSWSDPIPRKLDTIPFHISEKSLFPEDPSYHAPIRMGMPRIVDMGKELANSKDGYAYFVSQGITSHKKFGDNGWNTGDQLYLARFKPAIETINKESSYEFFAGNDIHGHPQWTHEFKKIRPIIEWNGHVGVSTITYNPGLRKYILFIGDGFRDGIGPYSTYCLESDSITGPFKLISYLKNFGPQAYFANIPSKFISDNGHKAWLSYSANYYNWEPGGKPNPPGSKYALCLQEIEFLTGKN